MPRQCGVGARSCRMMLYPARCPFEVAAALCSSTSAGAARSLCIAAAHHSAPRSRAVPQPGGDHGRAPGPLAQGPVLPAPRRRLRRRRPHPRAHEPAVRLRSGCASALGVQRERQRDDGVAAVRRRAGHVPHGGRCVDRRVQQRAGCVRTRRLGRSIVRARASHVPASARRPTLRGVGTLVLQQRGVAGRLLLLRGSQRPVFSSTSAATRSARA